MAVRRAIAEAVALPEGPVNDLELFVRHWCGQVGSCHLVFWAGKVWITVRATRERLPACFDGGHYSTSVRGNA
jgi:hypothetical protein